MRANGLEKAIMVGMGDGQRRKGSPRRRWLDEIEMLTDKKIWELAGMVWDWWGGGGGSTRSSGVGNDLETPGNQVTSS